MVELCVKDLVFAYHSAPVLDGIKFEIRQSRLLGITGPNGSGKSTLVKCIDNILKARSGYIYIGDRLLDQYKSMELARTLAYVPQQFTGTFSTSVFDTILLGRRPHTSWRNSHHDHKVVEDVIVKMGLEDIALQEYNELSGGQQQKVQIARAIAQQPEILLLDEPVANLDIRHQHDVMNMLASLTRENGILCIAVIHDLNLALKYMDELILMHKGKIFATGSPSDVLNESNVKTVYDIDVKIVHIDGSAVLIT